MQRYFKQTILKNIGEKGQRLLLQSKVVIVGAGATGSRAIELLARAGVGELVIIDRDVVEIDNLQRQTLFSEKDVEMPKAAVIEKKLKEINSSIKIKGLAIDLDSTNVILLNSNLVLDCTDNLSTRFLINEYCRKNKIPCVYCAVVGTKGTVLVITPKTEYCFRCIFNETSELETCETAGVINTIPSIAVGMQITEAIKILTLQEPSSFLLRFDVWQQSLEKIKLNRNPNCPVCNNKFEYLEGKKEGIIKFCGASNYQIKGKINLVLIKNRLKKLGKIVPLGKDCFAFMNMTVFKDRVLIKARTEAEAKNIYSKYIGN